MRMHLHNPTAAKRPVNMSLNSDLAARARREGLNRSALTDEAPAAAPGLIERAKFEAEIAQARHVHEQYLAEHGSLGDAIRTAADAGG